MTKNSTDAERRAREAISQAEEVTGWSDQSIECITRAIREAVEQERERIYKAVEIRWKRRFMDEVRAILMPDE